MKIDHFCYFAAAALAAGSLLVPTTRAARRVNLSVNANSGPEHCSDLTAKSNGEVARAEEMFTLQRSDAAVLELNAADRGVVRVRGWDRPEYAVETCKIAAAEDRAAADQLLRGVSVTRSAGRFTSTGPAGDDGASWQVYFIVHAPKDGSIDVETRNGPVDVEGVGGTVKVRAQNGPVSVKGGSLVEVRSQNGPIAFEGSGGEVYLNATNGPIALRLEGEVWNGPQLEARTVNGPLSLNIPEAFRTGVRVETSKNAPVSCRIGACQNAWSNSTDNQRVMQLNGSQDTIRVSTENGPVSVGGPRAAKRII